jgi:hypothetical protein
MRGEVWLQAQPYPIAEWREIQIKSQRGRTRFCTNPWASKPLSPPTVTGCVPGSFSNIINAASRSASRSPGTLPRPRSARCGSRRADSRCSTTSTSYPRLCAPAAPRDQSSIRASHSTVARRESSFSEPARSGITSVRSIDCPLTEFIHAPERWGSGKTYTHRNTA